jgi:hypothetical protein
MEYFEYQNYKIRISVVPNNAANQINIYNPNDAGHSVASFVQTDPEKDIILSSIFDDLTSSGDLDRLIEKANQAFAATGGN